MTLEQTIEDGLDVDSWFTYKLCEICCEHCNPNENECFNCKIQEQIYKIVNEITTQ